MSKSLPWILGRRIAKEDQGLTVHICLELVCLIILLGHLGLQVSGLLPALADLCDESRAGPEFFGARGETNIQGPLST